MHRFHHNYAANLAEIALDQFTTDSDGTCRRLNSSEWWGPGRCVAEIELVVDGGLSPDARRDSRRLRLALLEISQCTEAYGESNEAAELQVAQFDKWVKSEV